MKPDSRLTAAAHALQERAAMLRGFGDNITENAAQQRDEAAATAVLLERLAELAPFWHEPYAAPFVPIIAAGVDLAEVVTGSPTRRVR